MNLPVSLSVNPMLSTWVQICADGSVLLRLGKVELGQGITTSLCQIAADELGVDVERLGIVPVSTSCSPNEGWTSASISIEVSGQTLRLVCAEIRYLFQAHLASRYDVHIDRIVLRQGCFYLDEEVIGDYSSLRDEISLDREYGSLGNVLSSSDSVYVGSSRPRLDMDRKLSVGGYIQDFALPGMWHGRVIRPALLGADIVHVDVELIEKMDGVGAVFVRGNFVGICGENEYLIALAASKARNHIHCQGQPSLMQSEISAQLRAAEHQHELICGTVNSIREDGNVFKASYSKPFLAHASIGTVCAVASVTDETFHVWTQSQGIYPLRNNLARYFVVDENSIIVEHIAGAGCYGHNGADDVVLDACILARALDRPVRVVWDRADELSVAPLGSAMVVDIEAMASTCEDDGSASAMPAIFWQSDIYSYAHLIRPGWGDTVNLLAASETDSEYVSPVIKDPPMKPFGGGGSRNAIPLYQFAAFNIEYHLAQSTPVRTSALRSLGAFANVFAIESFIDELSLHLGVSALAFRLQHLADRRAIKVIERVVAMSGYSANQDGTGDWGRGLAFAQYKNNGAYFAVVVELDLALSIRVSKVFAAVDAGLVVNPDGLKNQIEGGIIQAISWTLKEQVQFTEEGNVSRSWDSYPILGFAELPDLLRIDIIEDKADASFGVGECAAGPVAAAIANGIQHALGVRIRDLPITYEKITSAIVA